VLPPWDGLARRSTSARASRRAGEAAVRMARMKKCGVGPGGGFR
jgi:hypothetical protein